MRQPRLAQLDLHQREQRLDHLRHVTGNTDVRGLDLVQLGRIDVHMDDLGPRAELGRLADGPVIESRADADQQIGLFEHIVGVARAVHAEHADGQRMVDRHGAQRHQRHRGRQPALLGQRHRQMRGAGVDHAAAKIKHRPLGRVDHLGGLFDGRQIQRRQRIRHGHRRIVFEAHHLALHVLRHIDQHRAGAAGHGDAEGFGNHLEQIIGVTHQEVMLGQRDGHPVGVHFLEGVGADHAQRHLTGNGHHGDRVELGVSNGGDQVGRARAGRGEAHLGLARDAGHALRHEAAALLVTGQHMVNGVALAKGIVKRQDRAARDAAHGLNALSLKEAQDQFGASHLHHVSLLVSIRVKTGGRKTKPPPASRRRGFRIYVSG